MMEKEAWKITDSLALYGFTVNGHRWLSNKHLTIRDDHIDTPRIVAEQHYKGEPWATGNNRAIHPDALEKLGAMLAGDYTAQAIRELDISMGSEFPIAFMVDTDRKYCVGVNPNYIEAYDDFYPHSYWIGDTENPTESAVMVKDKKGEIVGAIMPVRIVDPLSKDIAELLLKRENQ